MTGLINWDPVYYLSFVKGIGTKNAPYICLVALGKLTSP